VPPELLRYLGRTFCVWQHAVPLLESHTVIFPDETRCFDALAEMYKLVGGRLVL
jgi:transformation/transcription domain-associated protein